MKTQHLGKRTQQWILSLLLPAFAFNGGPVQANPSGGVVVHGAADFANVAANQLLINQTSQNVIINWQDFSIAAGEITRFAQPTGGAALNRVVSGNVSQIYGTLQGNANVYVINPNGIFIGASGVIDIGGRAVISTLDIDDNDFLDGGDARFYGDSTTGVTNFGTITSSGGDVVLMGGFVDNHGQIGALNGTVAIGSGGDILLQEGAGAKISVRGASDYTGTGIDNQGTIQGASAELKAHGNVYALAINNGGAIRANGADRSNGRVRLTASGGSSNINLGNSSVLSARVGSEGGSVQVESASGMVELGGSIDVAGTKGGEASVVGRDVTQLQGSTINASGSGEGGQIQVEATRTLRMSGAAVADGGTGAGGRVDVTGRAVLIKDDARISADGGTTGGKLRIGGDFQGQDSDIREADWVHVGTDVRLSADSLDGDAGTVIVWSNDDTTFWGDVSARAKGEIGNGGLVEISGKRTLNANGTYRVDSATGRHGTVLFDPGNVVVGNALSTVSIASVNALLEAGGHVLIFTDSGNIEIQTQGGGGSLTDGATSTDRDNSIQWTNSDSSFIALASGSIFVNNHIRTSGGGSVNLLAGWAGKESGPLSAGLALGDPQAIWDHYVSEGLFGAGGGSVFVGSSNMTRHVEVGSRYGSTNVAGYEVRVQGGNSTFRYSQIGFHDGGQMFAPRLNKGSGVSLDMRQGAGGDWYLSDGLNSSGAMPANGVYDPIVAIAWGAEFDPVTGKYVWAANEADVNGDGIIDGVRGINSDGVLADTFIPYASHYNSANTGNWWWQQIVYGQMRDYNAWVDGGGVGAAPKVDALGSLRPEYGAGQSLANRADINVVAKGSVSLLSGPGGEGSSAMIGHGGFNHFHTGDGVSRRNSGGSNTVGAANFSHAEIEQGQMERRWSFNGAWEDRSGTSIARLAPVYGNINVLAGVDATGGIVIDRAAGKIQAQIGSSGNVLLQGAQPFSQSGGTPNSPAMIGHGGVGQFGQFYGDIAVKAGHSVILEAGGGTRSTASIGHTVLAYQDALPVSNKSQQLRFFATTSDFDNPNLRYGELYSGVSSTGFDPAEDPARYLRYTLGNGYAVRTGTNAWTFAFGSGTPQGNPIPGSLAEGNYVPEYTYDAGSGTYTATGNYINRNDTRVDHANGGLATGSSVGAVDSYAAKVIPMNPLLYTLGNSDVDTNNNQTDLQGRRSLAALTLSPVHSSTGMVIEGLHGSVINGFHGNIEVSAGVGDVRLVAYSTPSDIVTSNARDTRFASIGHGGGMTAHARTGAGYWSAMLPGQAYVPGITSTTYDSSTGQGVTRINSVVWGREWMTLRVKEGDAVTGTASPSMYRGDGGDISNRQGGFMTITGDIDVKAGGNVYMKAGNDIYDYTIIGHGGKELGDPETSSFILGDIRVDAGDDITLIGGGETVNRARESNYDLRASSQIGHGGAYRPGFLGYFGDIEVTAGGSISLLAGARSLSPARIGHQGVGAWGQVGGDFSRNEHFVWSYVETTVKTELNATTAKVTYSSTNGGINEVLDFSGRGLGSLLGPADDMRSSDIKVTAGGSVTLDHMPEAERKPDGQYNPSTTKKDDQNAGLRTHQSFAQIGHGGDAYESTAANYNNTVGRLALNQATAYGARIGDVEVTATTGDVIMKNGTGEQHWTRIGHGLGADERYIDNFAGSFTRAAELVGDIKVVAKGDIILDADAAEERERDENSSTAYGSLPSKGNPVAIGHGGVVNNSGVVVISGGELVKGVAASSNITVVAGQDLEIRGGKGVDASYAQIGHGHASTLGDDNALRNGIPTGFSGDIDVHVGGNLLLKGNDNAWTSAPSSLDYHANSVMGGLAAIGHGGYQLDAPASGDIRVYVGGNLDMKAQVRTSISDDTILEEPLNTIYVLKNPYDVTDGVESGKATASAFNFAKIGHFSAQNGNRAAGTADSVRDVNQTGDITVTVNGNLSMAGGTTDDVDLRTIYGAFVQIGHGGPSVVGNLDGDIAVLVKGDLSVVGGSEILPSSQTKGSLNNYAKIGHGDYVKDALGWVGDALFSESAGARYGNIQVLAGRSATFDGSLVGHIDPALANSLSFSNGNLAVAVSRLNPFYGGGGDLIARNSAVFASGGSGLGTMARFFMPARSNNKMDGTTRINEAAAGFSMAPGDFAAPFNGANGKFAGRADEVYLTPDLWWDDAGRAAAQGWVGSGAFPVVAASDVIAGGQAAAGSGGAVAGVSDPGGLANLATLAVGELGSSATPYRNANGFSGGGFYTLYYDAIQPVANVVPIPPALVAPPIVYPPFDFSGYFFDETYDAFFRDWDLWNEIGGDGSELYPLLGLFERDSDTQEENGAWKVENRLDDMFGPRRDSTTQEEDDEDEISRRKRAKKGGPVALTYYVYEPGTNRYSSYRVFGNRITSFYPEN